MDRRRAAREEVRLSRSGAGDSAIRSERAEWSTWSAASSESARLWTALVDTYLTRCLERQSAPRVKELAALMHLSRDQLGRAFEASTGISMSEHFRLFVLEYSKRLLCDGRSSVTAIAYRSGFEKRRTFYRFFRRMTGTTPGEYRSRPPNVPSDRQA
jgi:AraC-like DNA-binding protein